MTLKSTASRVQPGRLIRFNKKFYNRESVAKAARQFKGLARLEIDDARASINVSVFVKDKKPFDASLIADEIANRALAEMKAIL
ncbi:MAG: HxsD-like protein [Patescibacteria group bacterium]|nr:HxsD-like protein [Patescibacteria group bacterium]MCL5261979.1 HxsD-like protein [Patescibacteria group bacterium]